MWVNLNKATTPGYLRYDKFIIYKIQETLTTANMNKNDYIISEHLHTTTLNEVPSCSAWLATQRLSL